MEYERLENKERPAAQRVRDWDEFHIPISAAERSKQGARCMNCGVPFCQAGEVFEGQPLGCPLNNLIPEWNDQIMDGNYSHALARLLQRNNFPEFTGRVCPAFCEKACTCGIYDCPVTIRDNELEIIEHAFADKTMKLRIPAHHSGKNVAVIGSGPAGLAVADQLNHRGHFVTVIEKHERAGGILTYGIPNMKLPKKVVQRRIDHMTDEGVSFVFGVDASDEATAQRLLAEYDAVILCCGSEKPRDFGFEIAGVSNVFYAMDYLHATVERQQFGKSPSVPSAEGMDVIIIGTGNTASDCVASAIRQGCRSVTQLVRRPESDYLTASGTLPTDYAQDEARTVFGSDPRIFSASVAELLHDNGKLRGVRLKSGEELPCDMLIGATGFSGCDSKVCAAFGVEMGKTVLTEEGHYQTNIEKVFTAGDMHRGQSLVVHAIHEGRSAAVEVDKFLIGYTNLV